MFYSVTYLLTTLGTFGIILLRTNKGFEAETLEDLKGMSRRNPWFAFLMLVMMFSLAGIPPTVGFYAKLSVLDAVVKSGMTWLAVVAVMFSLIGAFYYLRVVKLMYFDAPVGEEQLEATMGLRSMLSLNGAALIVLGIFPAALMNLCYQAVRATLGS
jgi:NADH-quinone oxidoreductase subunit N